jgi:3-oxoacyl-[acyl-carrier-protein] synthase-3
VTLVDLSTPIGIMGYGLYIPENFHSAKDVADGSGGRWTDTAVQQKLGFDKKPVAGPRDGTQAMGAWAAADCLRRTGGRGRRDRRDPVGR